MIKGFADICLYFGPFGAATKVKLVNNLLVAINIAATAEAMALGLKAGVDIDLMIKAIASGSGGSTQFGIRAPWMAQRRSTRCRAQAALLFHYFHMIEQWADSTGTATPLLDRAIELYQRCVDMGYGESHDVAVMIDVINSLPRRKLKDESRKRSQMIRVKKIAHATYEMPDLEKQIAYYTDILGLTLVAKDKAAAYLADTVDHHSVVLKAARRRNASASASRSRPTTISANSRGR